MRYANKSWSFGIAIGASLVVAICLLALPAIVLKILTPLSLFIFYFGTKILSSATEKRGKLREATKVAEHAEGAHDEVAGTQTMRPETGRAGSHNQKGHNQKGNQKGQSH